MKFIFFSLLFSIFVMALLLNSNPTANAELIIIETDTVTDSNTVINENDVYQINQGITLRIEHKIDNYGIINNDGIIHNIGWGTSTNGLINNYGTITNNGIINNDRGGIRNNGTIDNLQEINNNWNISNYNIFNNMGTITNNPAGDIDNKKTLTNSGTIINYCNAQVRGNEITGNSVMEMCGPPVLDIPENITTEATGNDGASVNFEVTATDALDGILIPSCDKESGIFPIGITTITCSVEDSHENYVEDQFSITVQDTISPKIDVSSTSEYISDPIIIAAIIAAIATIVAAIIKTRKK